jgi:hypothetical protein
LRQLRPLGNAPIHSISFLDFPPSHILMTNSNEPCFWMTKESGVDLRLDLFYVFAQGVENLCSVIVREGNTETLSLHSSALSL